jgi:hypothetical protein
MIRLHAIPEAQHDCPHCNVSLQVRGWYIPGMRNLADLICPQCERAFYGDLPAGHGLYYPMLLEQSTGAVHDVRGVAWFADLLASSYANRVTSPIGFRVEHFRPLKRPILLNCLDVFYGHCLLKLLNAQYYLDHRPDVDLIVMVPSFLRWMVPEGVASIWTVELPLSRGSEWNDWLATEIGHQLESMETCGLSVAFSHPHPEDYDIARFTLVPPFANHEWDTSPKRPVMTFIWREDRFWPAAPEQSKGFRFRRKRGRDSVPVLIDRQARHVEALARELRSSFPNLDFAVAGLGRPGGLHPNIADLRTLDLNDSVERSWCQRYAKSCVVIGVHGSNMLLPSAHAGAVVNLVPHDRWGNLAQDILSNSRDVRETMFRFRFLAIDTSPTVVAEATASLIREFLYVQLNYERPWNDHESVEKDPRLVVRRFDQIRRSV